MSQGNGAKGPKTDSEVCFIPGRVEPGRFRGEWFVVLDAVDPQCPKHSFRV
jgi:hypothetical protein